MCDVGIRNLIRILNTPKKYSYVWMIWDEAETDQTSKCIYSCLLFQTEQIIYCFYLYDFHDRLFPSLDELIRNSRLNNFHCCRSLEARLLMLRWLRFRSGEFWVVLYKSASDQCRWWISVWKHLNDCLFRGNHTIKWSLFVAIKDARGESLRVMILED